MENYREYKCQVQAGSQKWVYEYEARSEAEAEQFVKEDMQEGDTLLNIWSPQNVRSVYTNR